MKLTKKIFLFACGLSLFSFAFADDFDDFGDFGDSSYGETEEPKVELGGLVEMNARSYVDHKAGDRDESANLEWDDVGGRTVAVFPTGRVNIGFSNNFSDVEMKLKLDKFSLQEGYYQDILDEFTARAYIGNFQFEAGKMRVVWGKGDKLHVLDNFNANDYTDYIIPEYIDRRIAEPMFRAVYSTNNNIKFEGIYAPFMTADRLASNGMWVPKQSRNLTAQVEQVVMAKLATAISNKDTAKATAELKAAMAATKASAPYILLESLNKEALGLSELQSQYSDVNTKVAGLDAIKAAAAAAGMDAFLVYNSQTGANLANQAEFDALYATATDGLHQLSYAIDSAKLAASKRDKTLASYGYANMDEASAGFTKKATEAAAASMLASAADITAAETAYTLALNNASSFSNNPDSIYPDLYQLKYGQFGFRTTFTLGSVDLGLSYYNGRNKQPSVDATKIGPYIDKVLAGQKVTDDDRFLAYDRLQVFGFEAAGILFGRLNSRMEFAYNMTEDFAGDDPAIHNHSLGWVAGFDVDLPINNINVNIQTQGKYILMNDKIEDNNKKNAIDVDYDDVGYSNDKIVLNISDSYRHEKIKVSLSGIYGIERSDLIVMPTLTFNLRDDFNLNLSGMYIWCKDSKSEFDGWQHNSFAQIGVKYQF